MKHTIAAFWLGACAVGVVWLGTGAIARATAYCVGAN